MAPKAKPATVTTTATTAAAVKPKLAAEKAVEKASKGSSSPVARTTPRKDSPVSSKKPAKLSSARSGGEERPPPETVIELKEALAAAEARAAAAEQRASTLAFAASAGLSEDSVATAASTMLAEMQTQLDAEVERSDALQTLLDDMQGKTVWIDTPGADFSTQAQQLQSQLGLHLHAVLPVDATVTSVQKILQNPEIRWSSLMLTKVDEAAYPWPLIKGLCEQPLAVSCMAEDSKINVPALPFGAARLVDLAMTPLQALLPQIQHLGAAAAPSTKAARKPRVKNATVSVAEVQPISRAVKPRAKTMSTAKAVHG
jgi:hypothetical protein